MLFHGSKLDLHIQVNRLELITILDRNRIKHEQVYQAAVALYKTQLVEHAKKNLERAEKGLHPEFFPNEAPKNYKKQYERAINMLQMSDEATIRLSAIDFARFVEDDWDWKASWTNVNTSYGIDTH